MARIVQAHVVTTPEAAYTSLPLVVDVQGVHLYSSLSFARNPGPQLLAGAYFSMYDASLGKYFDNLEVDLIALSSEQSGNTDMTINVMKGGLATSASFRAPQPVELSHGVMFYLANFTGLGVAAGDKIYFGVDYA